MEKLDFDISPSGPYFSIIRSALWKSPLDTSGWQLPINWESIIRNYDEQSILPLVAPVLVTNNSVIGLSQEVINYIFDCVADNVRKHYFFRKTYLEILGIVETKNYFPILLKGEELASRYPQPNLRSCGDIDLYVPSQFSADMRDLLLDKGALFHSEQIAHHTLVFGGAMIEIHHHFCKIGARPRLTYKVNKLLSSYLESDKSIYYVEMENTAKIRVLPPHVELLYVFTHLVSHIISGIGLRQFADLAILIAEIEGEIDERQLKRDLCYLRLTNCWNKCINLLSSYFGLHTNLYYSHKSNVNSNDAIIARLTEHGNFAYFKSQTGICFQKDGIIKGVINNINNNLLLWHFLPNLGLKLFYANIIAHITADTARLKEFEAD